MAITTDLDAAHGFDFLFGDWRIANRRLVSRLTGSKDWERFTASCTCRPILGGLGNIDDFRPEGDGWAGFEGGAVRIFDPHQGRWAIHWMDNVRGALYPPMFGRFEGGTGEFFGDDEQDGTPVRARFIWSGMTPTTAEWQQAFSADGGATWETNWTMSFTRLA